MIANKLEELAYASRPQQFILLERAISTFTQSHVITRILVRGSLATGTADRMSDLDFVLGIHDADYISLVHSLNALMSTGLGAILPGWRDTIVRRMGGIGYVFLVARDNHLYQMDVYVAPESAMGSLMQNTRAQVVWEAESQARTCSTDSRLADFIEAENTRPQTCAENTVEILVLIQMMLKRIKRGQRFVLHAETQMLTTAVKDLIKVALAPTSMYWGWYHLDEEIGITDIGRSCLQDLYALVSAAPLRTADDLFDWLRLIETIIERAAPEAIDTMRPAIEAYKEYLELA
jgi:hypothetical protein